jgi:predicted nuclease of predicted toxin-antitoxin system
MKTPRFFADHCIPTSMIASLQDCDYQVLKLRDYIPIDSPDKLVIDTAQRLDAILFSLNGDFADILAFPPADYKGIISIQLHNHPEIIPFLMERLQAYLSMFPTKEHFERKLFIVEVDRIRIHG